MSAELKTFTINLKTLSQTIESPIVVSGEDAGGFVLRVILTQQAADGMTGDTSLYLKWTNLSANNKGYDTFKHVRAERHRPIGETWEMTLPSSMLREGDVRCCIEFVDRISVSATKPFLIHITGTVCPTDDFEFSDDFSAFKSALVELERATQDAREQTDKLAAQQSQLDNIKSNSDKAYSMAQQALAYARGDTIIEEF